jgi:hypothetical protein
MWFLETTPAGPDLRGVCRGGAGHPAHHDHHTSDNAYLQANSKLSLAARGYHFTG